MKVTFVPRHDGNLIRGGAEIQVDASRAALEKLGIQVQVLSPLDRTVGDVVHFFGPWESHWYCAATLIEREIPYVCSPIWLSSHTEAQEKVRRARHRVVGRYPRLLAKLFKKAESLIVLSQWERKRLSAYFDLENASFAAIPNGVDPTFADATPNRFGEHFGVEGPYVLHTGSFCERKNQLSVIRALKGTGIPIVFLGQPMDADYRRLCESEADSNMRLLPPLASESPLLPSAYAGAKVFCLPSTHEVLSLSALEAAVSGCSLVLGNTWGADEHFGTFARYVPPHSIDLIRETVQSLWTKDNSREEQSQHFRHFYSWDSVAKQLASVYENVLEGSKVQG